MNTQTKDKEVLNIYPSDIEAGINKEGKWPLCEKIANSYNETYGKGFNPSKMEQLFEALQDLLIECIDFDGDSILPTSANQAIKNATSILKNSKL